jgi:hypothetical protein
MEGFTLELLLEFALQFISKYAIGGITIGGAVFLVAKFYIERKIKELQKKRDNEQTENKKKLENRREFEEKMYVLRRERDGLEAGLFRAWNEVLLDCTELENKPSIKKATKIHNKLQEKNEEIKTAALVWEAKQQKEL